MLYQFEVSQNRDLWFTLPPQRSLLVLWLFLAIPISYFKFKIFNMSSIYIIYTFTDKIRNI